jgi:purine-binding chemotaxis protein CheW
MKESAKGSPGQAGGVRLGDEGGEGARVQLASFFVGAEEYALDIMRIKEIINPVAVTRVPRAPAFIEGIIELRGAFLPIIDLRRRFDLPVTPLTRDSKYVIVALAGRILGLVVDRVVEVKAIGVDQISPAPELALGGDSRYFNGVIKWNDRIVMMLDLDAVLSPAERDQLRGLERAQV